MKTYEEMVAWIKANVPAGNLGSVTPERAAIRWAAMKEAENIRECDVEHLANILMTDWTAMDGSDVTAILECEDWSDEETAKAEIEEELRRWFDVK